MYFTLSKKLVKENFSEIMSGLESEMSIFNSSDYIDDNVDEIAAMEDIANLGEAITSFGIDVIGLEADTESGASEEKKKGRLAKIGAWLKEIWEKLVNYIKLFFNSYARKLNKIKKYLKELEDAVKAGLDVKDYGDAKISYGRFNETFINTLTGKVEEPNDTNRGFLTSKSAYVLRAAQYVSYGSTLSQYSIKRANKDLTPSQSIYESLILLITIISCLAKGTVENIANKPLVATDLLDVVKKATEAYFKREEKPVKILEDGLKERFDRYIKVMDDIGNKGLAVKLDEIAVQEVKDVLPGAALGYYSTFNNVLITDWFKDINTDILKEIKTVVGDTLTPEKLDDKEKPENSVAFSKDLLLYNKTMLKTFNKNYAKVAKFVFSYVNQVYKTEMKTLKEIEKLIKK